jgi:hypothetical protein
MAWQTSRTDRRSMSGSRAEPTVTTINDSTAVMQRIVQGNQKLCVCVAHLRITQLMAEGERSSRPSEAPTASSVTLLSVGRYTASSSVFRLASSSGNRLSRMGRKKEMRLADQ